MKIGLSYDLKEDLPLTHGAPEDVAEEYDSPETVEAIAAALGSRGHSIVKLGGGRAFLENVLREKVDLVFNIAEGRGTYRSREAQVPAVLEMLGIPYTGSDPLCLAVSLEKSLTKKLVGLAGITTPRWQVISHPRQVSELARDGFPFPSFVKPVYEGSSKGVRLGSRVENQEELGRVAAGLLEHYHQPVMVEEFMTGDEVTVGLVGNAPPRPVGLMRILPRDKTRPFIYSLEVKRDWERLVEYECPAKLPQETLQRLSDFSLKAFEVLGCRDFARVDFRLSPEGVPHFLEINPLAGLNPKSSDLIIMAGKMGWSYQSLIYAILDAALARYGMA